MPHDFAQQAHQRNASAWLDDYKNESQESELPHFYRQSAERKYMKTIWKCFIAVAFLASSLSSIIAAIDNDYDKATYFFLLAIFNYTEFK